MELFALDQDVAALESVLPTLEPAVRRDTLVQLSWHLRQRDCARALALADEAEALLALAGLDTVPAQISLARLQLVRAEVKALFADFDGAEQLAATAMASFSRFGDPLGVGDGHWLMVSIWLDRGNRQQFDLSLQRALTAYRAGDDPMRVGATLARALSSTAFVNAGLAESGLAEQFPESTVWHEAVMTWVYVAYANVAGLTNDPGVAIKYDLRAYQAASNTGQIRQALIGAVNAAEGFATLGDLDAALEWSERALSLARATRWPGSIGVCLMQTGDVLRMLSRHDEARTFLHEALTVMAAMVGSRNQEQVVGNLGLLASDMGDDEESLSWFVQLERGLSAQSEPDLLMKARRGAATALSRLGRSAEASIKAAEALALAQEKANADEQIKALRVLAELHRDHALPPPPHMAAPSATLHYLQEAMRIAESVSGYAVPAELLNQVASAYAASGDYRAAYDSSLAATAARNKTRIEEAQKRALAMQIRQEIDRARADIEHHQQLSAALQETNATLETLGLIGREITASLDAQEVFQALYRHVDRLLDAASFVIYLLDPSGKMLTTAFGLENGQPHPVNHVPLDSTTAFTALCARERREIVIDQPSAKFDIKMIPGTIRTMSMLFAPLEVGKRLLGVITIQSQRTHAYRERECSIFRTLCAYGAIALDNAAAYSAVEAAREQTARQEQELRVAATAFESQEGMLIADADLVILRVNSAFTKITGYPAEDVVGRSPNMFQSSRHDADYYRAMDDAIRDTGSWQGEIWTRRKDGDTFPLWLAVTAVRSDEGHVTHYVYALVDITERKMAEDEIRNLAFYDPLTNLPNRRLLMDRLRQALAKSARSDTGGALLFVDLDNFKKLNDTRGHDIGDLLLEQVAGRIASCLREGDTVARLGGDEFVVLLEDISDQSLEAADKVEAVAKKILATLNESYLLDGKPHHSTPSIGVCFFKGQAVTVDELLKQADLAMYQAKAAGRNAIRFFDPTMQAAVSAHAAMEADIREALASQQFILHYQPQVDTARRVIGAEALVRWQHPLRGMVSPASFIPLAEETGQILPLGQWVLETACLQLREWAQSPQTAHLTLAVNISARQFHDANFVEQVLSALAKSQANPGRLKLELTESLLLKDVDSVVAKMNVLMAQGVSFSLDDFGTGYSSLSYLKRLPLAQLKIDQSFVRDIFVDANDLAIVRAVVTLGQSLGLSVIAEGVETEEQRQFLEACGCHTFQGYLFGKPGPAALLQQAR
ncbi:EAL domain-containing protein [Chitinimonas naiadis]